MTVATGALGAAEPPSAGFGPGRTQLACVLSIALLALPACLGLGGGATRLAFAAGCFALTGLLLLRGGVAAAVSFVLWLFVLSPMIRRMADMRLGWADPSIVLLAPYMALAWAFLAVPTVILRRGVPQRAALLTALGVVAYGSVLAVVNGRLVAGAVDTLTWAAPLALGCLMATAGEGERVRRQVEAFFAGALAFAAAYAVAQFFLLPPWDAFWMRNAGMESIGRPLPLEVRVFGPLNSPGVFAFFLVAGILTLLARPGPLRLVAVCLAVFALGLSGVRAGWVALVVGLAVLVAMGSRGSRLAVGIVLGLGVLGVAVVGAIPEVQEILVRRATSFTELGQDTSALERLRNYSLLARITDENPWGQGLAAASVFREAEGEQRPIDSGVIEVALAFGLVAGLLYMGALGSMLSRGVLAAAREPRLAGPASAAAALGSGIVFGSQMTGTVGVFLFCLLALCARRPGPA